MTRISLSVFLVLLSVSDMVRGQDTSPTQHVTNSIGMKLVYIPVGEFTRNSHRVRLTSAFLMGTTEVTQGQWLTVMGNNPSHFKGDDLPVEWVSWEEAVEFCRKLSEKEGKEYRLPTEAEWEYACRAGTTTEYSSGDGEDALKRVGWYSDNSGGKTQPVGQKQANAWGLYDMHGNVWEWCNDWYGGVYPNGEVTDPTGPATGSYRVIRGGSWGGTPRHCRSAIRLHDSPGSRGSGYGFRVVCVSSVLPGLPE